MPPLRSWSSLHVALAVLAWLIVVPMLVVLSMATFMFALGDSGGLVGVGIDLLHISLWLVGAAYVLPPLALIAFWFRAREQR